MDQISHFSCSGNLPTAHRIGLDQNRQVIPGWFFMHEYWWPQSSLSGPDQSTTLQVQLYRQSRASARICSLED